MDDALAAEIGANVPSDAASDGSCIPATRIVLVAILLDPCASECLFSLRPPSCAVIYLAQVSRFLSYTLCDVWHSGVKLAKTLRAAKPLCAIGVTF